MGKIITLADVWRVGQTWTGEDMGWSMWKILLWFVKEKGVQLQGPEEKMETNIWVP